MICLDKRKEINALLLLTMLRLPSIKRCYNNFVRDVPDSVFFWNPAGTGAGSDSVMYNTIKTYIKLGNCV